MKRYRMLCCGALLAFAASAQAATAPDAYEQAITAAKAKMVSEPKAALESAKTAAGYAETAPDARSRAVELETARWLEAEAMVRLRQPAPALELLKSTYAVISKLAPNTKLEADVLKSTGRAYAAVGDVQQALTDYHSAYKIYQGLGERRGEAMALQEIGSLYTAARDYQHVMEYYSQSNEAFSSDPTLALVAHNNLGFALKETGKLKEAEAQFRLALASARTIGSPYIEASILSNIAYVQTLTHDPAAESTVRKGLGLADRDAMAASERPFLTGVLAQLRFQQGRYAEAKALIDKTFAHVNPETSTPEYQEFHTIAARIYERAGDLRQALVHQHALKRLDDQSEVLASSTNAALMAAQFDFSNQDLKISRLRAGQLERDILLAKSKAKFHNLTVWALLLGGGGVFAATLAGFIGMRRSRNAVRAVNADLTRALQAKTEFLATTSHEIRTPLNGMLGMTQVLLAGHELSPAARERLELMLGAGETMKTLVDDLLDTAKADRGEMDINPKPVALPRVFREVAELWRGQAELRGLGFTLLTEDLPDIIITDEGRLRQLLLNLTSNALKFTEQGRVELSARRELDDLVVEVRDTGIGIPKNQLQRIFEPFSQVDAGITRKFGGTGLGLPICKSICEAMGGKLTVQSELEVGTVFTARLPIKLPPETAQPEQVEECTDLASARVLVVEPNPLAQRIVGACLKPHVLEVACVADSAGAIDHAARSATDVVIIDAAALSGEPKADFSTMQSLAGPGRSPLLILTCPSQELGVHEHLRHAIACELVPKPIAPVALAQAVVMHWRTRMNPQALRPAA